MKTRAGFVSNSSSSSFLLTFAKPHKIETDGVVQELEECLADEIRCTEGNPEDDKYVLALRQKLQEAKLDPACGRRLRLRVEWGSEAAIEALTDQLVKMGVVEDHGWEEC